MITCYLYNKKYSFQGITPDVGWVGLRNVYFNKFFS